MISILIFLSKGVHYIRHQKIATYYRLYEKRLENFKFGFVGLTEKSASLLVMTPPPASREPPRRGSLLPRPAEIRYPTSDSYPRPKAPSPRGLRPQAVGEFTVMGIFTLSNSSINPNLKDDRTITLFHPSRPFATSDRSTAKGSPAAGARDHVCTDQRSSK